MNIGPTNYGDVYSNLEHARSLGIKDENVIQLTEEVKLHVNPKYPVSHQGNRERLRNLRQLQLEAERRNR